MLILLLKLTPIWGLIKKHWKIVTAALVFLFYSLFVFNSGFDKANTAWELREAERVKVEQSEEIKASREAAELKAKQDSAAAEREKALKLETEAAETRAAEARAEAAEQRRLNNESTKQLEEIQDNSSVPAQPIPDGGVRDTLHSLQDKVRSRRRP